MSAHPKSTPEVRSISCRVSSLARWGRADDEREARRDLAAAKLAAYAAEVVAAAPPLTDAQIDRIVTALRGGAA